MRQTTLFDEDFTPKTFNPASVPQLSPFRYPGGKTWFVPYIHRWLLPTIRQKYDLAPIYPNLFIEPFLGGGSISLAVTSEQFVQDVLTVEIDADVAAVWQTLLNAEDGEWLANRILTYNLTSTNVDTLLLSDPHTIREQAFQTIVKNRVNRGGILAPGAGRLKLGEDGKGILSRWYPATLAKRIRCIIPMRTSITFIHGDSLPVLAEHVNDPDTVFFIDPPYTAGKNGKRAGRRLYTHNDVDHEQLFDYVSHIQGDFLMTYDNAEEVHSLARHYNMDTRLVPMRNTHHDNIKELVIGRNLDWVTLPQPEPEPMS